MSSLPPGVTDAMCEAGLIDDNQPCGSCGHTTEFHDEEALCRCCDKEHEICQFIEECAKHRDKKIPHKESELCVIEGGGCTKECECKSFNTEPWENDLGLSGWG